jgi:hypothetical protein
MTLESDPTGVFNSSTLHMLLGPVVRGHVESRQFSEGIRREWKPGLRGTRIAFQLPYAEEWR